MLTETVHCGDLYMEPIRFLQLNTDGVAADYPGHVGYGPVKSSLLDFHIPTKKRSRTVRHSLSPFELLRRDLINVYQQDSSFHSASLEEVLLYESGDPTYSSEIVYGSYLLKSQSASSKEEESAASSPVVENKIACMNKSQMGSSCNEVSSTQAGLSLESMVNSVVSDRDAYDKHSPRISNNVELSHKEVFEPGKEISSLSAKRPLDPPYPPQALGSNYGTGKDFKRPKEGTFLLMPSSALKP
ncbi:hypothetical protein GIB67_022093 [Kingdonia uniflora]|uniref:Uncharacterized protein n=1 Tax=Kingdonia uniflora TaxID=39325 RepID=A0A7J7ME93_9MAGN|nr:hypothetical protein GIB67_022093 [Kingdonia uniflora]